MKNYNPKTICSVIALSLCFSVTSCATQYQRDMQQKVEDYRITTEVNNIILSEKELQNTSINVKTSDKKVQLSGYANTNAQQLLAVQIAMDVPEVKSVDNAIILKKMIKQHKKKRILKK